MSYNFDKSLYFSALKTKRFGKEIFIYNEVTSTNDVLLKENFAYGSVITAYSQTKGRGRSGRNWVDDGSSLIFSIVLTGLSIDMLMPFNIIAGFSVCNGICLYADAKLKWPNDCIINEKKTGGMLLEASFTGNEPSKIVFGAGINVYNKSFPEDISHRATSIFLNSKNKDIKKELILAATLNSMEEMLDKYKNNQLEIDKLWADYSAYINKKISIHINGEKKEMIEKGINPSGELIVQDIISNKITNINSGEIGYDFNG